MAKNYSLGDIASVISSINSSLKSNPNPAVSSAMTGIQNTFNSYSQAASQSAPTTPTAPVAGGAAAGDMPTRYTYPTESPDQTRYLNTLRSTAKLPVDETKIREERLKAAQSRIDAINMYYSELKGRRFQEDRSAGDKLNQIVRANNVRSGNIGSDFATANSVGQESENLKVIRQNQEALEQAKSKELAAVYAEIDKASSEEARANRALAVGSSEKLIQYNEALKEDRRAAVARLGALGTTVEELKRQPDYLRKILEDTDYTEGELEYELNKARNDATRIKYETKVLDDGNILMFGIDPLTNQMKTTTIDTSVPEGYKPVMKEGVMYWEDANGNLTKAPIGYAKQKQQLELEGMRLRNAEIAASITKTKADTNRINSEAGGAATGDTNPKLYSGLDGKTSTAVRTKVSAFKSEPLVQNYATIQEGRNFAKSLSDTTKNPADDQALIYSLAKALDPGSVVREGEYATAQKYAQSWVKAYGKGVEQALAGTGFLSQSARKNIKSTIESKFSASQQSYDNLKKQYVSGVNNLTGRADGDKFLVDYSIADTKDPLQIR